MTSWSDAKFLILVTDIRSHAKFLILVTFQKNLSLIYDITITCKTSYFSNFSKFSNFLNLAHIYMTSQSHAKLLILVTFLNLVIIIIMVHYF